MKLVRQALATLIIITAAAASSALVFAYLASSIKVRPLPVASSSPQPSSDSPTPPSSPGTPSSLPSPSVTQPSSPSLFPGPGSPSPAVSPASPTAGSIQAKVEERIKAFFAQRTGVAIQSVACPATVRPTAGNTFVCNVTAEGVTFPVKVIVSNDQGDFRVEVKGLMVLARLEQQIQETVKQKTGVEVVANCGPRLRITKAGEMFQCQLTTPQGTQLVQVTVEDDQGRVRWKL
ncbi:hypothetical protein BST81_20140 [Leptolyngbya sp. 'hensonii']|uniref:DUF4333 domain-containing protein n=1 Tax=Leptolyngbya sp. 'hensonii' TaxID=1922337 RepID=UPI0009502199|nr:DUF4333 domain-containing protein [Leptolyngbya sp. 'hensonii']OLP16513.1 hypothetical protein BST81_20140 [Leptolyngbya sp. 'hensonii']